MDHGLSCGGGGAGIWGGIRGGGVGASWRSGEVNTGQVEGGVVTTWCTMINKYNTAAGNDALPLFQI